MKVMTFNIRIHVEADGENAWPNRIESIAEVIKTSSAAIIAVQEAKYDMLLDLQRVLPAYHWIGRSRSKDYKDEHCPIFYDPQKVVVVDYSTFWLSQTPTIPGSLSWDSCFPRICTRAQFQLVDRPNVQFNVFNAHLDHVGQKARVEGVNVILEYIDLQNSKPFLIMGDFNAEPENQAIKRLKQVSPSLTNVLPGNSDHKPGKTFHDFKGGIAGKPIDYIFASNDFHLTTAEVIREKINERYPSDHYPILASLELPHL